ncbi:FAD:protein FMN transferase [uncultured Paracoccus sp.]|uniref:FAD:protein FMN transferase n=1 Tax=uncultured Paracoccus sp. TaxID=189685 RepID=UPI00263789F3|nr:FAD:protein FMN transferase [uncultured Paracoccus sp.]
MPRIDRRRFITIAAAMAGAGLLGRPALAGAGPEAVVWRGQSMGAQATLILNHPDPAKAETILSRVEVELRRLERIFTLYRADSELSRLNRAGVLAAPSPEMVEALRLAGQVHAATGGRFDPTVQPLWRAYATGADAEARAVARDLVGFDRVRVGEGRIVMDAGQELTLNGIAQGFITDRIVEMLRAAGAERTLVDMGEIRALGGRSATKAWRVGLARGGEIELADRALAVTEAAGFTFDPKGRLPHLIDPASGAARSDWQRIAVIAPEAGLADALSTGLSLAPEVAIRATLAGLPGIEVRALDARGHETVFG